MATQMTTYSPQRAPKKDSYVTFWQLYERAAKQRYGQDISVIKNQFYEKKVNSIAFELSVVDKDKKPREKTRTIVDINMKEYTNRGKEAQDETMVKMHKTSSKTKGERYHFSTTKGVDFGVGGNIGAQVVGLAVGGGSLGISGHYNKSKSKTEGTEQSSELGFSFSYNQEEKICVPPGTHVEATITTYSMKYEMDYVLKLKAKRNASLPVLYRTNCQQLCFGMCRSNGVVFVRDMISTLPDFNGEDEDETASFTQNGTLSWIGEGCSVEKVEEPLSLM